VPKGSNPITIHSLGVNELLPHATFFQLICGLRFIANTEKMLEVESGEQSVDTWCACGGHIAWPSNSPDLTPPGNIV